MHKKSGFPKLTTCVEKAAAAAPIQRLHPLQSSRKKAVLPLTVCIYLDGIRTVYDWRFSVYDGIRMVYGLYMQYTDGIRVVYGGSRMVGILLAVFGIRWYTLILVLQANANNLSSTYKKMQLQKQGEKHLAGTYKIWQFQQVLLTFETFGNFL